MKSEFAKALHGLLYHADLMAIAGWVRFFSVTKGSFKRQQIEAWYQDEAIPSPSQLFMAYDVVKESDCDKRFIEQFDAMAAKRSTLVSPKGALMLPTVHEYMMRPAIDDLSSKLAKLNTDEEKAALLLSLYPESTTLYVSNDAKARAEGRDKSWYDEEARRDPPAWNIAPPKPK